MDTPTEEFSWTDEEEVAAEVMLELEAWREWWATYQEQFERYREDYLLYHKNRSQ